MTYTEADVERVAKAINRAQFKDEENAALAWTFEGVRQNFRLMARAALAAMPSPAMAALQEARDACAAACRVIAEAGLSDRLEAELAKAGVTNGFGARMDAALAAMPSQGNDT